MKWTPDKIKSLKNKDKWIALTAYDSITAKWSDDEAVPLILVGDSLGMTALGYDSTLPVTMDDMLHHTKAVTRSVDKALVVADMPFMSYQSSVEDGIRNAGLFIKDGNADAVKIEGGIFRSQLIESLVNNGIPVLGHIGLTPQSIKQIGGYKVQGKTDLDHQKIINDALAVEKSGAFAVVLECIPKKLSKKISDIISIPTIGIGAGPDCDAQIIVISDLLGFTNKSLPKFAKHYADICSLSRKAIQRFKNDVLNNDFPNDEQSY